MSRFLALLCLVASAASGQEATGVIVGTVTDATTGDALPGVNVLLAGTPRGAATDVDGAYRIEAVPRGAVTLRFQYIGFETVEVEATLGADTLRVDAELSPGALCGWEPLTTYTPRGVFEDLPGRYNYAGQYWHEERPWQDDLLAAPADRATRRLAIDRGTDRSGRWQPRLAGLGVPAMYVDGVRVLSLDAIPEDAIEFGYVYTRYVPAGYGASAAGAINAYTSTSRGRTASAGVSGGDPAVVMEASGEVPLVTDACGDSVRQVSLLGEGTLRSVASEQAVDGRGRAVYEDTPLRLTASVDGAVRSRDDRVSEVAARARWGTSPYAREPRSLAISGGVRRDGLQTASFAAFRAELRSDPDIEYAVGAEGAAVSVDADGTGRAASSLAGYLQLGWSEFRLGVSSPLDPYVEAGLRVERIGAEGPDGARAVWTLQPRVLATLDLSRAAPPLKILYAYSTLLAGAVPDGSGQVARRAEAGLGVRLDERGGAVGYVRRVGGLGAAAVVAGADADVNAELGVSSAVWLTLWGRARLEWGDAQFARDRWAAGGLVGTRIFGRIGGHLDVSEGVLGIDGQRPHVVRLGASVAPGAPYPRPFRLHLDAVVRGRDAVPCVDLLGDPEAARSACPVPDARVLVEIPF